MTSINYIFLQYWYKFEEILIIYIVLLIKIKMLLDKPYSYVCIEISWVITWSTFDSNTILSDQSSIVHTISSSFWN